MMSYDKASPNAKIGCSKSNDPEFLEQLVREGKTNREIALILDLNYGSVAQILSRYALCGFLVGADGQQGFSINLVTQLQQVTSLAHLLLHR